MRFIFRCSIMVRLHSRDVAKNENCQKDYGDCPRSLTVKGHYEPSNPFGCESGIHLIQRDLPFFSEVFTNNVMGSDPCKLVLIPGKCDSMSGKMQIWILFKVDCDELKGVRPGKNDSGMDCRGKTGKPRSLNTSRQGKRNLTP
jgi:hypothetical protein